MQMDLLGYAAAAAAAAWTLHHAVRVVVGYCRIVLPSQRAIEAEQWLVGYLATNFPPHCPQQRSLG